MRTSIFLVAISLTALAFVKPTFAGDGVQRQDSALVREPLPKELSQLVSPAEIRGYSILGCLETLQKRKGISINIDQTGLEGLCKEKLREIRVTQVEFPLPLAAAVEYLAIQVHGTLRIRGKSFHIVAGEGDVLQFLSPPTSVVRNDLKKQVTIEKPIHDLPGCDILDFFGEKLEMRILLLPEQFDRKLEDSFRKRSCTLASGTKEAGAWIDSVLLQMRGRMVVRNEAIVVVPGIGKAN